MILYNYSNLQKRDTKIYSVAGTNISSTGISVAFLKVVAPCTILTVLIGLGINTLLGRHFFHPLLGEFNPTFVIMSIGSGLCIGLALWYIKIQTYRLYEYLIAYFKPKKTYHNLNTRNNVYSLYKIKTDAVITKIL